MARPSLTATVMQVQVPRELNDVLDQISAKSHVPKSVIVRMGIEKIVKDIRDGKIKLGISFNNDDEEETSNEVKFQE
jgi:predicted transcriptional regulator